MGSWALAAGAAEKARDLLGPVVELEICKHVEDLVAELSP
jgi:hypothetical protein